MTPGRGEFESFAKLCPTGCSLLCPQPPSVEETECPGTVVPGQSEPTGPRKESSAFSRSSQSRRFSEAGPTSSRGHGFSALAANPKGPRCLPRQGKATASAAAIRSAGWLPSASPRGPALVNLGGSAWPLGVHRAAGGWATLPFEARPRTSAAALSLLQRASPSSAPAPPLFFRRARSARRAVSRAAERGEPLQCRPGLPRTGNSP